MLFSLRGHATHASAGSLARTLGRAAMQYVNSASKSNHRTRIPTSFSKSAARRREMQQPKHTPRLKAWRTQMQPQASPVPIRSAGQSRVNERGVRMRREPLRNASAVPRDQRVARLPVPSVQSRINSEEYRFLALASLAAARQPSWPGWPINVPNSRPLGASPARPNTSFNLRANGMPQSPRYSAGVHFL